MRTITQKIYKYDELKEDVKEKLLKAEKEQCLDDYCELFLYDDMFYEAERLLKNCFGENVCLDKVYYDLSYSQGSGAMTCFTIDIESINDKYKIFNNEEIRYIRDKGILNDIKVYHNDNYYYHEYTFAIDYDYDFCWDYEDIKDDYNISEESFKSIEDRVVNLFDTYNIHSNDRSDFIKDIISINCELSKRGYEMIDSDNFDISICLDNLNEREYFKNGDVYYGSLV